MKLYVRCASLVAIQLCLLSFLTTTIAQFSISGRITDSTNNNPLAGVTVFLNNATKGTSTTSDGTFVLSNIKSGQYDLVISMIGYEAFSTTLLINANKENLQISLSRKIVSLKPYVVLPEKLRQRYYEIFKRIFIGRLENAVLCKILNPEIIFFDYDKKQDVLSASTDEFLVIENKALGYKIKFLLKTFTSSNSLSGPSLSYYEGQALFEEMAGSKAKKNRWQRNRIDAYAGSSMHFFRSAATNQLRANGFIMHTLIRSPNKDRPTDDSIRLTLNTLRKSSSALTERTMDSIEIWQRKYDMPKTIQVLSRDTLAASAVIKRTDQPGIYALTFKNLLYLSYIKKKKTFQAFSLGINGIDGVPFSILNLQVEYAFFDTNGIVLDPQGLIYEGYWADAGAISNLLPTDFELTQ